MAKRITLKNLYNFYAIEVWDTDQTGFCYVPTDKMEKLEEKTQDKIWNKMMDEFTINYERGMTKRSCMWADEVKRRANWVQGETLYGQTREKYTTYQVWWSKDKKDIGSPDFVIEADGFLSLRFFNGYTLTDTKDTKWINYIRPCCLYNDQV